MSHISNQHHLPSEGSKRIIILDPFKSSTKSMVCEWFKMLLEDFLFAKKSLVTSTYDAREKPSPMWWMDWSSSKRSLRPLSWILSQNCRSLEPVYQSESYKFGWVSGLELNDCDIMMGGTIWIICYYMLLYLIISYYLLQVLFYAKHTALLCIF